MTKKLCLIPARGGSKRIPRKNIKEFCGKPLISWSIKAALESNLFDEVYVSTDDLEIKEISEESGAKVPFMRPVEYAKDTTLDIEVRAHFLEWCHTHDIRLSQLCYLYPTAPFISTDTLKQCSHMLIDRQAEVVHTIASYSYPVQRALSMDTNNCLDFVWKENEFKRSQELRELFHDAGQCYFFNYLPTAQKGLKLGYLLPRKLVQDIDTFEDFEFAESLFRYHRNRCNTLID